MPLRGAGGGFSWRPVTYSYRVLSLVLRFACIEKITNLSQADFLNHIQPVTRAFFRLRNFKANNIADGIYLCDGGTEELVLKWKVWREKWIEKRDQH
jgi:hypothetical protein